jgi:hypothetical protein
MLGLISGLEEELFAAEARRYDAEVQHASLLALRAVTPCSCSSSCMSLVCWVPLHDGCVEK